MSEDKLNADQKKQSDRPSLSSFVEAYKKKMDKAEPKSTKEFVIDNIARHLVNGKVYPMAEFGHKFIVNSPEPGEHLFYEVLNDQKVVKRVSVQHIKDMVIQWMSKNWHTYPEILILPRSVDEVIRLWTALSDKHNGVIKSFEFKTGDSYVTNRIPFALDEKDFSYLNVHDKELHKSSPFFEFLSRCSAPQQLAAFIGSIFYEESYLQQYLYLWGGGNDGKGSLLRAIGDLLGGAFHSDSFDFAGKFWTSAFLNKRVVAFPDSNDQAAMQRGVWKQLTGGDPVRVEFKNAAIFTATLNAKFVITSNFAPVLKLDRADLRRIVIVEVSGISGQIETSWEKKLRSPEQLELMVNYCCWVYREMCLSGGSHKPIAVSEDQLDRIQNADETLEQKILENFNFGGTYVACINDIRDGLGQDYHATKVARILTQRFGCVKFRARTGGARLFPKKIYYAGIGLKFDTKSTNSQTLALVKNLDVYRLACENLRGPPEIEP